MYFFCNLGASGGSRIISAVAQVAIKTLWMGMDIKDAIDDRRVHHQLYPTAADIEEGFSSVGSYFYYFVDFISFYRALKKTYILISFIFLT